MTSESKRLYVLTTGLVLVCGCLIYLGIFGPGLYRILVGSVESTPDFEATLQVLVAEATSSSIPETPEPTSPDGTPSGHIVFTCQIYRYQSSEQICIMNADGSDQHQLTQEAAIRHYYPSLAPDGGSVVYSQYREDNVYEIYELSLADGTTRRMTNKLGVLTGPEISPDGSSIAFMRWTTASDQYQIWMMDRSGDNPRRLFSGTGWDPTWSPDGSQILFASDMEGSVQLYRVNLDGTNRQRISNLPAIRGRSDWSPQGLIATYSGEPWKREIYVMQVDGSDTRQVSPTGGNSQGPSFSPGGQWIAFTGYFDKLNDIHGCEIYIMRIDGSDVRRLTDNDYCDYQPRWGP
jgi:TolB protein